MAGISSTAGGPLSNRYLVTGCAGLVGWRVTELLLQAGHQVVGVDDLNDSYDPRLKSWRLDRLKAQPGFGFQQWVDIPFVNYQLTEVNQPISKTNLIQGPGQALDVKKLVRPAK